MTAAYDDFPGPPAGQRARATPQGLARIPLQALRFHPRNIRTSLGDLTELSESIRHEGVLVPLMAQRTPGGGLQLLHGHRRWAAADIAGLRTVPVVIIERTLSDDEAMLLMLAEDKKQPVDLADRARAVQQLHDEFGYDYETIAERLGIVPDELAAWRAGRATSGSSSGVVAPRTLSSAPARTARKPRRRAVRKAAPRVSAKQVHAIVAEWESRAPADLLAQLRALLGEWAPVETPAALVLGGEQPDEVEVEQLMSGARPLSKATTVGAAAAVARLTEIGLTAEEIADRLRCSKRQVVRYRSALAQRLEET